MLVTCYPLSIAWLRVRVARYTHTVYSPSGSCHSDVTSLPPLYRYPLSIAWLRVRVARYSFLFSLAWPWRMKSLVKHNMLKDTSCSASIKVIRFFLELEFSLLFSLQTFRSWSSKVLGTAINAQSKRSVPSEHNAALGTSSRRSAVICLPSIYSEHEWKTNEPTSEQLAVAACDGHLRGESTHAQIKAEKKPGSW